MHISNWKAARSGAAMTITGSAAPMGRAQPVKIPNVKIIEPVNGQVIATDIGGQKFTLRLD